MFSIADVLNVNFEPHKINIHTNNLSIFNPENEESSVSIEQRSSNRCSVYIYYRGIINGASHYMYVHMRFDYNSSFGVEDCSSMIKSN